MVWLELGLYKVEFRILEIRISGETNLKKHFLSGNWIRKKIFKGLPNRKEWCVLHNFKQPNCLVAFQYFIDSALHSNKRARTQVAVF